MVLVYKKAVGFGRRALSKTKLYLYLYNFTTRQDKEEEEEINRDGGCSSYCRESNDERWRLVQEIIWPSDSKEGSGEAGNCGGTSQFCGFHLWSSPPSINAQTVKEQFLELLRRNSESDY